MGSIERHDNCAVLFADISGSTKLYVEVGDERAREIVARTLDLWSSLTVERRRARDPTARRRHAVHVPDRRRRAVAVVRMRDLPYQPPLSMHAGIHAGAVLHEAEQLYGDVVNIAARMADIAKKFEIVLTEAAD